MRRFWDQLFVASVCLVIAHSNDLAAQQAYPAKAIRLIAPYAAGGSADNLARQMAQKLGDALQQTVIVDNRPGGNTTIGSEALVRSAPDGYTLILVSVDHAVIPHLLTTPYDAIKDFAPVGGVSYTQLLLVANPSVPANSLSDVVALAKAKPGKLNYASSGSGGVPHLTGVLFNATVGTKMQHIPYKGGGPALIDLIGGQVDMTFAIPINAIPHVKSGKVKAIAITGNSRLQPLPETPTFTETGYPGFDVKTWYAIFAPAGTPRPIIERLSAEIRRIVTSPEVKDKWLSQGMEPFVQTPEELGATLREDSAKYGKIIRDGNIKIDG